MIKLRLLLNQKAGLSKPIRITQFMPTEVVTIQLVWRLALHKVFEMVLRKTFIDNM